MIVTITVGTHNLLDGAGRVTPFADVILYTEAPPREQLDLPGGFTVKRCRWQRDLVAAWRPVFTATRTRYRLAHPGVPTVTPRRGTYAIEGHMFHGARTVVIIEHRINAAFPPYRRGEAMFRRACWRRHTRLTLGMIRRYQRRGFVVIAGGDLNTPPNVTGYRGVLEEAGTGFDRIASSLPIRMSSVGGFGGSDHRRFRAVLDLPT